MDAEQLLDIQRRVIRERIAAEEAGDWDRMMSTFSARPDAFFDAVPMHTIFRGKEEIQGFYAAVSSALPDFPIGSGNKLPIITESHLRVIHRGGGSAGHAHRSRLRWHQVQRERGEDPSRGLFRVRQGQWRPSGRTLLLGHGIDACADEMTLTP